MQYKEYHISLWIAHFLLRSDNKIDPEMFFMAMLK
jgi:hypothetical protein